MITEEQYLEARADQKRAEAIIETYWKEKDSCAKDRWNRFSRGEEFYKDEELVYAAFALCNACGAGLAYPKESPINHRWDCSNILKGVALPVPDKIHEAYPFAFYEIKSEDQPSAYGATTRPKT